MTVDALSPQLCACGHSLPSHAKAGRYLLPRACSECGCVEYVSDTPNDELDELLMRLTKALTSKHLDAPVHVHCTQQEWIESIVGTTVLDTYLVLAGSIPIEEYEREG